MYRRIALAWTLAAAANVAGAETVYKCQAGSQTIYQQSPCATDQHQQVIELNTPEPMTPQAQPPAADNTPRDLPDTTLPPPPPTPLPRMFGCVRATDGKPYTSADGNPQPYLAPLGVLGVASGSLTSRVPAASAPETTRNIDFGAATRGNYVWVQDTCRQLSPAETCQVLRDQVDANQHAIRQAFKSDRGPLDAKDTELRTQLRSCGA